tara:strand:- start:708 stop:1307 length:600 start_codon:yes stop_codon:yes gene_type:complete
MQSLFSFIVKPKNERYDNKKYIDGQELLLNTEISDHRYVSRTGIVTSIPKLNNSEIQVGNEVIVHHNVFRRWYNAKGIEKNSRSYYMEDKYFVSSDQIFLYKKNNKWHTPEGYCFVKPIVSNNILSNDKEVPFKGIVKYVDKKLSGINKGDLVGFTPGSKYEFIIEGERLYRVLSKFITIKYGRKRNEEEYNPSWTQSS